MRFKWKFDEENQTLHAPSGYSVTVREIAHWLQDRVHGRADLTGAWAGWKIRGNELIPPHIRRDGPRLTLNYAKRQLAQIELEQRRIDAESETKFKADNGSSAPPSGRPHLRLVHTRSQ
jgi:hypothetical protein